jgi:Flp pilus assembly protein CpaB
LKRSNRLVLLVGVFLAVVAFIGIIFLSNGSGDAGRNQVPTTGPVVVASADIPLSTRIRADQVTTKTVDLTAISAGAFTDTSQVIGKIAREPVATGAQITSTTLSGGAAGSILDIQVPVGQRAIAVQVDQVTGVGTVVQTGDYVDMVIGLQGDKFPVITVNPADNSVTVVSGINSTSTKLLLQGMQVLGTLLPPAAQGTTTTDSGTTTTNPDGSTTTTPPATSLNGQQQIVVLSVTPQQAEVIKFAQLDSSISLILRSADDFIDPVTGEAITPLPADTTGVILKTLVDTYGVLPPEVVETVTPATKK